jgi:hypothetical protein
MRQKLSFESYNRLILLRASAVEYPGEDLAVSWIPVRPIELQVV